MNCPKCNTAQLVTKNIKGKEVAVDTCPQCKGIWFDEGELESILDIPKTELKPKSFIEADNVNCPKCSSSLHMFIYPGTMVYIDYCGKCKGIWLDDGEIKEFKAVRELARVAKTKTQATETVKINCPKCGKAQPKSEECVYCGVIFARLDAKKKKLDHGFTVVTEHPKAHATTSPGGLKGILLNLITDTLGPKWG